MKTTKHSFTEAQQNYIVLKTQYENEVKEVRGKTDRCLEKIEKLNRKIKRLEKKENNINYPSWMNELLLPILKEIAKQTPDLDWDFESEKQLNNFGLRCECPVFAHKKGANRTIVGITFTPGDLNKGELFYDTGKKLFKAPQNSISNLNNFGNEVAEVKSIEQLIEFVKLQVKKSTN
ncbi:MAG: hypothetical protein KJ941_07565 [Bacteroidetes bacterium]|nr:hypothetical protein [Bacteroidota bacterium]